MGYNRRMAQNVYPLPLLYREGNRMGGAQNMELIFNYSVELFNLSLDPLDLVLLLTLLNKKNPSDDDKKES